jgi:hypothetical protein
MTTAWNIRHTLYRAPSTITDPGASGTITIDRDGGVCHVITATAEARTLRRPTKSGITGMVVLKTAGGALTLTVTGGYNADGDTSITFDTAGDYVRFASIEYGGAYYWRIVSQEGTNVAGETLSVDSITATNANATTIIGTTVNATTSATGNTTMSRYQVTATAVNAAGSAIGNAAALSYGVNIVGAADNTTGVILPVAVANAVVEIISTVNAKSLLVYPQVNSAIAGLGANAAMTLGPTNTGAAASAQLTTVKLIATNATQWYVMG